MSLKQISPLFRPTSTKALTSIQANKVAYSLDSTLSSLRDFISVPATLELGAALFIPAYLLLHPFIGSYVLLLPLIFMAVRFGTSYLQGQGYLHNPYMDDVVMTKFAAQIPDEDGSFPPVTESQSSPDKSVVVLLIGAKCNHPMGLLAPGFKELGDHFNAMNESLLANREEYGLINISSFVEAGGRASSNQQLSIQYFRSSIGLNKFAHSAVHREGWEWFNKHAKQYPHLSIFHEIFEAPAGSWEGIYLNSKPMLLGGGSYPIQSADETEKEGTKWLVGAADATKGPLASMKGRMSRYAQEYE